MEAVSAVLRRVSVCVVASACDSKVEVSAVKMKRQRVVGDDTLLR